MKRFVQHSSSQHGLTVIEVFLVISILVVVLAIAYPIISASSIKADDTALRSEMAGAAKISAVAIQQGERAPSATDVSVFVSPIGAFDSTTQVSIRTFGTDPVSYCLHGDREGKSLYYLSTTGLYTEQSPNTAECP